MMILTEVCRLAFEDLNGKEKVEFCEWLHKEYQDFIQFSKLTESERKVWNHFYPRPSEALGLLSSNISGEKK